MQHPLILRINAACGPDFLNNPRISFNLKTILKRVFPGVLHDDILPVSSDRSIVMSFSCPCPVRLLMDDSKLTTEHMGLQTSDWLSAYFTTINMAVFKAPFVFSVQMYKWFVVLYKMVIFPIPTTEECSILIKIDKLLILYTYACLSLVCLPSVLFY